MVAAHREQSARFGGIEETFGEAACLVAAEHRPEQRRAP
jgi:hypothetical protein